MNKLDYLQKISELYELNDKSKIKNITQKIDLFISNLSKPLRFGFVLYFLILRFIPSFLHSEKTIQLLNRIVGLRSFHEIYINLILIAYYDEL